VKVNFDFREIASLSVALGEAGRHAPSRAKVALRKTAADIERDAKILAPVDTGDLENSISTTIYDGGLSAEIGPTAEYGLYVEVGTSTMPPQAFLGPASDRHIPLLEQALLGELAKDL
jgi:HK97 gp10 family phage protein